MADTNPNTPTATAPEKSPSASPTSSRSVTHTVNGSHKFVIQGYSLAKGMGPGKHIASDNFTVGGYQWAVYFYPDGKNIEDNSTYVSIFIALASDGTDVRALFELTLVDQSGKGKHKVHSHFERSLESGPYTLKYRGSMWGYKRFLRRSTLENSDYLKDDCLQINCTVGVVVSSIEHSHSHTISVPESNIGAHFGALLENLEGSDVTFNVDGENFQAHKLILAARSPIFRFEFFNMLEENKQEIIVKGLEPNVFKALLHFMYTDNIAEDVVVSTSNSSSESCMGDNFMAKLLAAADRYGLERLRLMCESHLCKNLSVRSVAQVLSFADQHHAAELKAVCLRFAAMNLGAVMQSKGFERLKEINPSLQSELLKTLAQCGGDICGSGSKSRSVWAQLSDGGDSNGRRVRQRT
ncbi:BTB/POZ and MATH domain-containing protein 5-like [Momordica charantia]|uniref:BTB/POZ and MATH domain-containing protein 5-like n=1 Tax=Momordica charantia TaxID=3673 RepID=A0A6J1D345_MOMCH|nr:BTB/POZ and MATH domain-containing protein 5-like [Momordica charantia]